MEICDTTNNGESAVAESATEAHCQNIASHLNELRTAGRFCDVVLIVGQERFPAHKAVLCTAGGYFSAVFDHDLKEKDAEEIELPTICPSIMNAVLDYIYTGVVSLGDLQISQNVLIAADYLNLTRLKDVAINHTENFLTTANFLHTLNFADRFNFHELSAIVEAYIQRNFSSIVREEKHLNFTVDQFRQVLCSDDLTVQNELEVFHAVVAWIRAHIAEKKRISELFGQTRLCEIPQKSIVDVILREELVLSDDSCLNLTLTYLKEVIEMKGFCSDRVTPTRKPRQVVEAVMVLSGSNQPMVYLPHTDEWYNMPHMQWEHKNTPIALCDGNLYVTSGRSATGLGAQTEVYNPDDNEWSNVASLPASNYWPGLVALHGFLYVVGGRTPANRLKSVWRYDPRVSQWLMVAPLQEERSGPAAVTCQGYIYAIGGRKTPNQDLNTCEKYNPTTNIWSSIATMKTGRSLAAATAIGHQIFVIGGSEDIGMYQLAIETNEVYNCELNEWTLIAKSCSNRVAPGICSYGDKIYIFGGRNQQQSLTSVEEYDKNEDSWKVITNCDKLLNTFSISCCMFYLPKKHLAVLNRFVSNEGPNIEC